MKSKVAFARVAEQSAAGVQQAVERAMGLVAWDRRPAPRRVFLKVNLLSQEVMPGQCTSPWVFAAVAGQVRRRFPEAQLAFGDCEVATSRQVEGAVRKWGLLEIGQRQGLRFVNLSRSPARQVEVGPIFGRLEIPEVLLEADLLITVPVVKTHCITPFTGALKNQWGLLPRARFKYHPVVHQAIAEINAFFAAKLALGVADLTVAMEGPGPRVGRPKVCDLVMASADLVALDALAAQYMGFSRNEVLFLQHAQARGLGSMEVEVVGDDFAPNPFERGRGRDYVIYRWRDRFAGMPVLSAFLRQAWFFRPLGWVATQYAKRCWYRRQGKAQARQVCTATGYGAEFGPLIEG